MWWGEGWDCVGRGEGFACGGGRVGVEGRVGVVWSRGEGFA